MAESLQGAGASLTFDRRTRSCFSSSASFSLRLRVREIPTLDARFASEKARLLADVWDVAATDARVDQVGALLHSTPRTEAAVLDDIASYDAYADSVKASFAARKP